MKKGTTCTTGRKLTPTVLMLLHQFNDPAGVDVDDLMPYIKDIKPTREQVIRCLHNLKEHKRIVMIAAPRSVGGFAGSRPARYALPGPAQPITIHIEADSEDEELPLVYCTKPRGMLAHIGRVSSVWQLGAV